MKFSENWLRSFVNPSLSSDELAHALTMAGIEVESIEAVAAVFDRYLQQGASRGHYSRVV